jgi:hypothetical protein
LVIKDVIESITTAARKLFSNWGALLISLFLYAALIAVSYLFVTTREATWWQVSLSLVILPVAAIALFFALQAMGLSYVRIGVGPIYLLKRALKDCWLLFVVSLPVIALGAALSLAIDLVASKLAAGGMGPWTARSIEGARLLINCFALPLLAMHLWIATIREGLAAGFKGFFRSAARAFAPRSVLIYVLVVALFGAIAWLLLSMKTHIKSEWGELWLVGARVTLALVLVLLGWLIALGAMAEMTARKAMNEIEV